MSGEDKAEDAGAANRVNPAPTGDDQGGKQEPAKEERPRFLHIDWARAMAIHLVIWVHSINTAEELWRWHYPAISYKNPRDAIQIEERADGARRVLLQVGIPVFFYISGFSVTFFNTEKKGFRIYLCDKFKRLIVPLIWGVLACLIPRLYLSQDYSDYGWPDGSNSEYNIFKYYGLMLPGPFVLAISWLWFLPALFVDSMIAYPLLAWSQRRYKGAEMTFKDDGVLIIALIFLLLVGAAAAYVAMPADVGLAYGVPSIGILFAVVLAFFFVPHNLVKRSENGYKYSLLLRFIGVAGTIALNPFRNGYEQDQLYLMASMINYDLIFMCQGLIDQIYSREQEKSRLELSKTVLSPFMVLLFFVQYSSCAPVSRNGQGYIFTFPMYDRTAYQTVHVVGTWFWLFGLMLTIPYILNSKFGDQWYGYELIVSSSMYLYVTHYLWALIPCKIFIQNTRAPFWWTVVLLFFFTELLGLGFWVFLGCCKKKWDDRNKSQTAAVTESELGGTPVHDDGPAAPQTTIQV